MELQSRRIRVVPQRLDISTSGHWIAPTTCQEPVQRDGPRLEPCGQTGCDCEGPRPKAWHHEKVVPVWSFRGCFQGYFPKRFAWGRMVSAETEIWLQRDLAFLWQHDGVYDQNMLRWVSGWLHDPYVFAALAGLEIE